MKREKIETGKEKEGEKESVLTMVGSSHRDDMEPPQGLQPRNINTTRQIPCHTSAFNREKEREKRIQKGRLRGVLSKSIPKKISTMIPIPNFSRMHKNTKQTLPWIQNVFSCRTTQGKANNINRKIRLPEKIGVRGRGREGRRGIFQILGHVTLQIKLKTIIPFLEDSSLYFLLLLILLTPHLLSPHFLSPFPKSKSFLFQNPSFQYETQSVPFSSIEHVHISTENSPLSVLGIVLPKTKITFRILLNKSMLLVA